ncbi:MAG: VOC family protein [Pseudomonas sp.]|jgi:glyoxalase family protein|uniref:Glyoxalase family protein n=1 Tax=Pseudomonas psychrophila TaxID=122355 RepID=A0ABY0VPX4_9PSED|nr:MULTISPECIES: VOC family protein [Pseudomonas]KAB0493508.1 glyoxalase [Pseudomonas psychrophila]KMN02621.1 glyoxalase [Pseudomonas psychrophila]MBL1307496.1 VOC family protein [Pseudomonas sp.]QIE32401.1 glyoxalase [Pseudomonas psychrophila]WVI98945.1 VOC family protein [Pseudomonas psychrophila]
MELNPHIQRHHHITLNVGGAQEDYDFHTKVLGLKSVKKTGLYDGAEPIYHLYYGNDMGEESTLVTCFPMRQSGRKAKRGTGQVKTLALSVPVSSLGFWATHLTNNGFKPELLERFGEQLLHFAHPCGIEYELVGIADDDRKPYSNGVIPEGFGIRGTHGITVSVRDMENSAEFMHYGWSGKLANTDGAFTRFHVGKGGSGTIIDFQHEPQLEQGTWAYGEGTVHHCAFEVSDLSVQKSVKYHLEGMGYTDVSDRKDRGYFDSIYVRTPGGALFEATVSKPQGFLVDEPYESLGQTIQIPPQLGDKAEEISAYLEPLKY